MGEYVEKPKQPSGGVPGFGREDMRDRSSEIIDDSGNIDLSDERVLERANVFSTLDRLGYDSNKLDLLERDYEQMLNSINYGQGKPGIELDVEDPWSQDTYEFQRSFIGDMAVSFYNRGAVGMLSGIAQIVPSVALAASPKESPTDEFFGNWISSVNKWEEGAKLKQSDKAKESLWDNPNANNIGSAFGDGLGFVADIMLGSKGFGTAAKALSYGAKMTQAARLGSFITGTLQMQKDLFKEGRRAGLNDHDNARMSIGLGSIVSLMEGAAIEQLGLIASRPITGKVATSVLKGELSAIGKAGGKLSVESFEEVTKQFARKFGTKLKGYGSKAFEGYTVEAIQEGTQTYMEEWGKNMYDVIWGEGKKGQGRYGADVTSKKTFQHALTAGLVGGLVGGVLGGAGSMMRGVPSQTLHNYIDNAVLSKKPGQIVRLKKMVNKMNSLGKIENSKDVHATIDKMIKFSQNVAPLGLKSSKAKLQLFQLMDLEAEFQSQFGSKYKITNSTPGLIANAYRKNENQALMVNKFLQLEMQDIIDNKDSKESNPVKFEKKLNKYVKLFQQINSNKIDPKNDNEVLKNELVKLMSPRVKKAFLESALKDSGVEVTSKEETPKFEYYDLGDNKKASQEVIDNFVDLATEQQETAKNGNEQQKQAFKDKLEKEYGVTEEEFNYLKDNWKFGKKFSENLDSLEKIKVDKDDVVEENRIESLEKQIAEQQKIYDANKDAKAGDNNVGIEAKQKLEKLQKELKIEQQATFIAEKPVSEVIGFKDKADSEFYKENLKAITKRAEELRKAKKPVSKTGRTIKDLIEQVKTQKDLTENDLNAFQKEADEIPESDLDVFEREELINEISKRREKIKKTKKLGPSLIDSDAINKELEEAEKEKQDEIKAKKKLKVDEKIDEVKKEKSQVNKEIQDIKDTLDFLNKIIADSENNSIKGINEIQKQIETLKSLQKGQSFAKTKRGQNLQSIITNLENDLRNSFTSINAVKNRTRELEQELNQLNDISNDLNNKIQYYQSLLNNNKFSSLENQELDNEIKNLKKTRTLIEDLIEKVKNAISKSKFILKELLKIADSKFKIINQFAKNTGFERLSTEQIKTKIKDDTLIENYSDLDNELTSLENEALKVIDDVEFQEEVSKKEQTQLDGLQNKLTKIDRQIRFLEDLKEDLNEVAEVKVELKEEVKPKPKPKELISEDEKITLEVKSEKADIEKRRKDDLEIGVPLGDYISVQGNSKAQLIKFREYLTDVLGWERMPIGYSEGNLTLDYLGTTLKIPAEIIEMGGGASTTLGIDIKDVINAKYDAELAALEKAPKPDSNEAELLGVNKTNVNEKIKNIEEQLKNPEINALKKQILEVELASIKAMFPNNVETIPDEDEWNSIIANIYSDDDYDQRVSDETNEWNEVTKTDLFSKLSNHFQKLFPNIPINIIDNALWKFGPKTIAQVNKNGININKNTALQTSLIHEFAHVYLEILGRDNPIIKNGLKFIKDTQFFKDAQEMYPDYTLDKQLEEALIMSIEQDTLQKLETKLSGSNLKKFLSWLQKFWNTVKLKLGINKGKTAQKAFANIIAEGKLGSQKSIKEVFNNGQVNRDQRINTTPQHVSTVNQIQTSVANLKMNVQLGKSKFDPRYLNAFTYSILSQRLASERAVDSKVKTKIFDSIPEEIANDIINESNNNLKLQKMKSAIMAHDSVTFDLIETSVSSLTKNFKEDIDNIEDLILVELKGNQKISNSTISILTGLLNNHGFRFNKDLIYQKIAMISDKSYDVKTYKENLEKAILDNDNEILDKLNRVLNSFDTEIANGVITELASLTNIEYRSLIKNISYKDGQKEVYIGNPIKNKSLQVKEIANEITEHLATLSEENYDAVIQLYNVIDKYKDIRRIPTKNDIETGTFYEYAKASLQITLGREISDDIFEKYLEYLNKIPYKLHYEFNPNTQFKLYSVAYSNKPAKEASGQINKLAELIVGESKSNSFVNQSGNNVSAVRNGYWISQFNKMFTFKKSFKDDVKNSPFYKNNPYIEAWSKTGKLPKWFIHDAFQNVGAKNAVEHNREEISDHILNNVNRFFLNKNKYYQTLGVTGDRTHSTYFETTKLGTKELQEQFAKRAIQDKESILNAATKEQKKGSKGRTLEQIIKQYNNTSLNKAIIEDGKVKVLTVFENKQNQNLVNERAKELYKQIEKAELLPFYNKQVQRFYFPDGATEAQIENSLKNELKSYVLNENLNRSYLQDIYAGDILQRKSVADIMKRMGGSNSGGAHITVPKPVTTIVVDSNGLSDSFSFNGRYFQENLKNQLGEINPVGINVKDMLYQINSSGDLTYYKMSTLGLEGGKGNNSFYSVSNVKNDKGVDYGQIGDAIITLEDLIGNNPYIKIIDKDVVKGNISDYNVIKIEDFINGVNNINEIKDSAKKKKDLENFINENSKTENYDNYRSAFNINKDFSKVPLSEQNVILSTQLQKILLNYNLSPDQINDIEDLFVNILKEDLLIPKDANTKDGLPYAKSNIVKSLYNVNRLLQELTANSEESTKSELIELLEKIKKYNSAEYETVYQVGSFSYNDKQLAAFSGLKAIKDNVGKTESTNSLFLSELKKYDLNETMFNNAIENNVIEDFENKNLKEAKNPRIIKPANPNPIIAFDHPNLRRVVQQFISSKLTKAGVRTNVSGIYSHMIPDISGNLKGYYTNKTKTTRTGKPMEIAVPWSMFVQKKEGETDEQAHQRANQMLEQNPEMFKTVLIRVPGSGPVSKFAGQVKFFTDGKANTSIVPQEFVDNSDADHDGDKIFIYRAELKSEKDGSTVKVNGNKTKAFDAIYDLAYNESMIKETNDTLDLKVLEDAVKEAGFELSDIFNLQSDIDNAKLANNMSFGADAIGIWAISSKMLSMFSQSQEQLRKPIEFTDNNGKTLKLDKFKNDSLGDVARFLQAALDMANNPIHVSTGINKHTIHIGTTLSLLGVDAPSIIKFLRNPVIEKLVKDVSDSQNSYNSNEYLNFDKYIEEQRANIDAPSISGFNEQKVNDSLGKTITLDVNTADGVYKATNNAELYFKVTNINENNFSIELTTVDKLENKDDVKIIKKFQEINKIAKDIQRLIPIMSLDNQLPNSGFDTEQVLRLFDELQRNSGENADKEFSFTTNNFSQRPLLKHFRSLLNQQQLIYLQRFASENRIFYRIANDLAIDIFGKEIAQYKQREVYDALTQAQDLYQAQNILMKNVQNAKVFTKEFANKIDKIIKYNLGSNQDINPVKPGVMSDKVYKQELDAYRQSLKANSLTNYIKYTEGRRDALRSRNVDDSNNEWAQWLNALEGVNEESLADYKVDKNALLFLQNIIASKKDLKDVNEVPVINPKSFVNQYSVDQLEAVQDSFDKLPISLKNEFVSYAMLRFGIASKINSLSKLFPSTYEMEVMKKNSNIIRANKDLGGMFNNEKGKLRIERLKLNTALMLKNDLPKPNKVEIQSPQDLQKLKFNQYGIAPNGGVEINTKADFVNIENEVYKRYKIGSRVFYPSISYNGFNDGTYTQMVQNTNSLNKDYMELNKIAIEYQKNC